MDYDLRLVDYYHDIADAQDLIFKVNYYNGIFLVYKIAY